MIPTKMTKMITGALALLLMGVLAASITYAAALVPVAPNSVTERTNFTKGNLSGWGQNDSRGFVYENNMAHTQASTKWKAYVGNITGSYGLVDASNNAIYDWSIITTKGEVYATHSDPAVGGAGVPSWAAMACATEAIRKNESLYFNHGDHNLSTPGDDEDAYINTWKDGSTAAFNHSAFFVGETSIATDACYGTNLYSNNAAQTVLWQEVVLSDLTCNPSVSTYYCSVVYAALIANNSVGFNGKTYDYQILVPEQNANGTPAERAYWFYIELV